MSFELKNVKSLYNAQNCLKTGLFRCSYYTGDYECSIHYRMGPCSLNRHRQKVHSTYCKKCAVFPAVDPINLFFVSTLCKISYSICLWYFFMIRLLVSPTVIGFVRAVIAACTQ